MPVLLTIEGIDVFYGGIHALRDVSLTVNSGEVVTLIGANGAGKSTTLRAITGLLTPRRGRIVLETGAVVLHGDAERIASDPRVREAYLGE